MENNQETADVNLSTDQLLKTYLQIQYVHYVNTGQYIQIILDSKYCDICASVKILQYVHVNIKRILF